MFAVEPEAGEESPFNNDGGEWGEGEEIAPMPVGVLRGHIAEAKKLPSGKTVLNVQCDDPNYAKSDEIALWPDTKELLLLAGTLGIAVHQQGTQVFFRDSQGNTGLKAFVGKAGVFIFAPYKKDGSETASIGRFGLPKPKSSDLWDGYWEQSGFGKEHEAALKKSRGGAVPSEYHELFNL
jgi:hypothetical protein